MDNVVSEIYQAHEVPPTLSKQRKGRVGLKCLTALFPSLRSGPLLRRSFINRTLTANQANKHKATETSRND